MSVPLEASGLGERGMFVVHCTVGDLWDKYSRSYQSRAYRELNTLDISIFSGLLCLL